MFNSRKGPKAEYREQQRLRVCASTSLAVRYPLLKSLTATLEHRDAYPLSNPTQLKYMVNLTNAKSVFRFKCPNGECIRGDFDLSDEVAAAVAKHRTAVTGELSCRGTTINRVRCANTLRYKLRLGY
jgi:hypothetical protein